MLFLNCPNNIYHYQWEFYTRKVSHAREKRNLEQCEVSMILYITLCERTRASSEAHFPMSFVNTCSHKAGAPLLNYLRTHTRFLAPVLFMRDKSGFRSRQQRKDCKGRTYVAYMV